MTVLYSPYYIWNITSKPEWYLENIHHSEWYFSIREITLKPKWYLENNHLTECEFFIHLMIFEN
jgi:hypothetical protein